MLIRFGNERIVQAKWEAEVGIISSSASVSQQEARVPSVPSLS